jgi:hypothetical protein
MLLATIALASTLGWTNFEFFGGRQIFLPVTVGGHASTALLITGGGSQIDKTEASTLGLRDSVGALDIRVGDVTLRGVKVKVTDLAPSSRRLGHPLGLVLGDDAFTSYAVDIDFAHQRIAFRDPGNFEKPAGVIEMPLDRIAGIPTVSVSVEGRGAAPYWFGLGNSAEMLIYQSYYQPRGLLDGRRTSVRAAGGAFTPETVAVVRQIEFAGERFGAMPAAFISRTAAGPTADSIFGMLGLPVLARFRLIIDYSHNRLYVIPNRDRSSMPFAKDRLGLVLVIEDSTAVVRFVAPHSPSEAAGFAASDRVAMIDDKPMSRWTPRELLDLRYGATDVTVAFTMADGRIRRVTLADYF